VTYEGAYGFEAASRYFLGLPYGGDPAETLDDHPVYYLFDPASATFWRRDSAGLRRVGPPRRDLLGFYP
jgi:hypothetical protein